MARILLWIYPLRRSSAFKGGATVMVPDRHPTEVRLGSQSRAMFPFHRLFRMLAVPDACYSGCSLYRMLAVSDARCTGAEPQQSRWSSHSLIWSMHLVDALVSASHLCLINASCSMHVLSVLNIKEACCLPSCFPSLSFVLYTYPVLRSDPII